MVRVLLNGILNSLFYCYVRFNMILSFLLSKHLNILWWYICYLKNVLACFHLYLCLNFLAKINICQVLQILLVLFDFVVFFRFVPTSLLPACASVFYDTVWHSHRAVPLLMFPGMLEPVHVGHQPN